jgi:predicted nuclease of predicted toxin-antitoxin system
MFILLDENLLSKKLKQPFLAQGHSVLNVYDVGWRGLKDKEILDLAENYPFDAFITADKNLPYQQNLATRSIRVIVINTQTTRPYYLLPLMEKISEFILSLSVGSSIFINDLGEIKYI